MTAWLWAGLLIGVSFIATPAKFLAPSISLPVALEVGQATFRVFRWVECAALLILVASAWPLRAEALVTGSVVAVGALLAVQYFFLLPVLDARLELIVAGAEAPPSRLHNVYVVLEVIKAAILIAVGFLSFDQ